VSNAETTLAPKHTGTDLPFGQVVGRLHAFDVHEGPQGFLSFEDVTAGACGFVVVAGGSLAQQFADLVSNRLHLFLEGGATHSPILHLVPPLKHRVGLGQDGFANALGFAAALNKRLEVPQEARPA